MGHGVNPSGSWACAPGCVSDDRHFLSFPTLPVSHGEQTEVCVVQVHEELKGKLAYEFRDDCAQEGHWGRTASSCQGLGCNRDLASWHFSNNDKLIKAPRCRSTPIISEEK